MDFDIVSSITQIWENYGPHVINIGSSFILAILIIIGGKIIISLSRRLINSALAKRMRVDETLASVLRVVIQYGVIIICLIMILDIFGFNTAGLIALLGAAGVAVAFALRDTLSNIAAGIILIFLHPFKKGDFIECGPLTGTVKEMGLFSTMLDTPDGICITAPNSNLWGLPIKNFSHNERRRMDIPVTISYSDSIDAAFQVLSDIIREEGRFLKDPPAQVMVQSLGESGTVVTLRAWVPSAEYWLIYWDQMKTVKEKIQEAGINIAMPRRDIRLVENKVSI